MSNVRPRNLEELELNHNLSLDLAFLPTLGATCPRLKVLKMDLQYYSLRHTINDVDPKYDVLLRDDEMPTWPTTLQELELIHLQRTSPKAAENLFRSLVESAKDLPELRRLVVQAHINIPWRDRAGFRDQWIERLHRVYLRKSKRPDSRLASLRTWREFKATKAVDVDSDDESLVRRSLSHVQVTPRKRDSSPARRRSRRVAAAHDSQSATPAPDSGHSTDDDVEEDDWRHAPEAYYQNLCEIVDIRIDNQRPREEQYTEGDFLDSEISGDDDYMEGAEVSGDEDYAW